MSMRLSANAVLEGLALEQFHGDKRAAFEFSNIVNGADVGMIERGCGARFAAESLDGLRVLGNVVGKEFQRNVAAQGGCPWLCRPRPSLRRPVFPGRCSGRWCGQQWRKCPARAMNFTLAAQGRQSHNIGRVGTDKRASPRSGRSLHFNSTRGRMTFGLSPALQKTYV